MSKLPIDFYLRDDVVNQAKELLGKYLVTNIENEGITAGIIVETEAYAGIIDRASHAYGGRLTNRTKTMYLHGGHAYIYLIYGMYELFNLVTGGEGTPHAILIRAIEPVDGIGLMLERRGMESVNKRLTAGPGVLTRALGITRLHNGADLTGDAIWIEDRGLKILKKNIISGPRINVDYAKEDALLPWRFSIAGNKWVSPVK